MKMMITMMKTILLIVDRSGTLRRVVGPTKRPLVLGRARVFDDARRVTGRPPVPHALETCPTQAVSLSFVFREKDHLRQWSCYVETPWRCALLPGTVWCEGAWCRVCSEISTRADTTRNMLACTAGAACFLACRSCTIGGTWAFRTRTCSIASQIPDWCWGRCSLPPLTWPASKSSSTCGACSQDAQSWDVDGDEVHHFQFFFFFSLSLINFF